MLISSPIMVVIGLHGDRAQDMTERLERLERQIDHSGPMVN